MTQTSTSRSNLQPYPQPNPQLNPLSRLLSRLRTVLHNRCSITDADLPPRDIDGRTYWQNVKSDRVGDDEAIVALPQATPAAATSATSDDHAASMKVGSGAELQPAAPRKVSASATTS